MKNRIKKKGKRLLAAFLCFLAVIGLLPMDVFAFTPQQGQSVTSYNGDYFVGSDGDYYYNSPHHYITYDSAGNVTLRYTGGTGKRRHYMIEDSSGERRRVYCIESGVAYDDGNTYTSQSGQNSAYFQNLPYTAQYGIMLTSVYGWQPGKSVPVAGCNEDDYIYATQCLLWEFQQQIRTSPYNMNDNAYGVEGNAFYVSLVGRPAQKCYDWMLEQMAQHATIPSFASNRSSSAQTHTLKFDPVSGRYSLTLEDTNNTLCDLKFNTGSGITVSRSGNRYTFTSDRMIEDAVTISAQKNIPGVGNDMLIWGRVGYQTMMCGAEDPVVFYVKINTETFGTGRIRKTSEDGKVDGIQFHITGNGVDETVATKADGTVDISLRPGTYTVTEVMADRYEDQNAQTITIVSGQTSTVTFNNKLKRGSLEIRKTSEDGLVEGVTFHLYGTSLSGLPVDAYAVTDSTGKAVFSDVLISGSQPYTVEEVDTAIRYVVPADQTAAIEWNKVTQRGFTNVLKKFRVEVGKTDVETGYAQGDASLAGAIYGLYQGDTLVASYTTGADGSFVSEYFVCGSNWSLREISPSEGYLLDGTVYPISAEPGSFTVELNRIPMGVTEEVIKGRIRLVKHIDVELEVDGTDAAGLEAEAQENQSVSGGDAATGAEEVSSDGTEASAGTAGGKDSLVEVVEEVRNILAGAVAGSGEAAQETVGALEESAGMGSEASAATENETSNESADRAEAGSDVRTGTEESATDEGEASETGTVDVPETEAEEESGETADVPERGDGEMPGTEDVSDAGTGDAQVPETEIPEEYQPVKIPKEDIEASGGQGIIEQPEEGAVFQIYLAAAGSYDNAREAERDILVTDADGFAMSKDLPYGRYTVHQIEGIEGQTFVRDFTVFISSNGETYSYIINNQTQSSFIRVEKHDIETGNIIPAANIGFQVRDMATGELITQKVYYPTPVEITTYFTNDEGWLMLPCELPYGEYELIEVQTCYGYVLDSTPVSFTVDGTQDVVVVEKHNIAQKGTVSIGKTGEVWSSVSKTDKDGDNPIYTPVYEVKALAGAVYEIRAAEDIYTLDGTLRAAKGEVVDTVTTGDDGRAVSRELYLGQYEVVEIEAPYGMVLDTEAKQVVLAYAGQDVALTETGTGFYNERQKVQVSLEKFMEQDEDFGIGDNGEVINVLFGLYAAADLAAADGSVIPADGLIEIIGVSAEGIAIVGKDLPLGSYYLQERGTDAHYLISDEKYPVEFTYAGQETALVEVKANDGEGIENRLLYGSVSGRKTDEDGEALVGAKIGLFDASVEEFTEETAILVTVSDEDGAFRFDKVPYGKWTVREIEAPEGFVLCTDLFEVDIREDEQVVEIEIVNEFIRGNLHLTKFDKDYPDHKLSGAVFEVYRDTNGNKELDEDDELLGIMEEVEPGEYVMEDLLYGGVFVKEKTAPDGFYLDEGTYYVSIETDGETYEVENDAGKGFYNQAKRGNLKIVKTSSDGRVEGFSFRIVGDNYDQTFRTDAGGVILVEGLRIGRYTVTEVEDSVSSGYKRPEPVIVDLVADETLVVNLHNEKIPEDVPDSPDEVTVEVPKTGDDSRPGLWLALFGISAAGMGTTVFLRYKKRSGKSVSGKDRKN